MRIFRALPFLFACIACAAPLSSGAQQADSAPLPPQLEKLEEGEETAITIRKPAQRSRTSEKRAPGGRITEIKVTSGDSTYYLRPNEQADNGWLRTPQWEVAIFDLSSTQEEKEEQAAASAKVPPPPAPAAPAQK